MASSVKNPMNRESLVTLILNVSSVWADSVEEVRSCRRWAELIQSGPGDRSAFDDGGTSRPAGCAVLRVLAGRTCAGEALAAVDRSVRRTRRAAAGTGAVLQSDGAAIG